MTRSIYHLQQAEQIGPNYRDMHQQLAHVFRHQQPFIILKERLMKSSLCLFTMCAAIPLWQIHWNIILDPSRNSNHSLNYIYAAQVRQQKYQLNLQKANEQDESRATATF